jgi:hypothetical protein
MAISSKTLVDGYDALRQMHLDGARIGCRDRHGGGIDELLGYWGLRGRIEDALEGGDHVRGGERLAIAEAQMVAQMEGDQPAIGAHGPARGQRRIHLLRGAVEPEQNTAGEIAHHLQCLIVDLGRVEGLRVVLQRPGDLLRTERRAESETRKSEK